MPFTIYGIVITFICGGIYLFSKSKKQRFINLLIVSMFCYLNIDLGYCYKIGGATIASFVLVALFTSVASLGLLHKLNRSVKKWMVLLMGLIIVGLIMLKVKSYYCVSPDVGWDIYLFGKDNRVYLTLGFTQFKELIKAISFILVLSVSYSILSYGDWFRVVRKLSVLSKFTIIYNLFEVFYVYVLGKNNIYTVLLQPIFGLKGSTYTKTVSIGEFFRLQGLFTEPSLYSICLFMNIILYALDIYFLNHSVIVGGKRKKILLNKAAIAVNLVLMCISMSLTSVLFIFILVVFYVVYKCKTNPKLIVPILTAVGVCAVVFVKIGLEMVQSGSYYGERIMGCLKIITTIFTTDDYQHYYDSIKQYNVDGSSIARIGSSIANIRMTLPENYLVGVGIGNSSAHSFTSCLITDLGILGSLVWVKFAFFSNKYGGKLYTIMILLYLAFMMFTSSVHVFGTDVILMSLFFGVIYAGKDKYKKEEKLIGSLVYLSQG